MPYIIPAVRDELVGPSPDQRSPFTAGELNYVVTRTCHEYLDDRGVSYTTINEVIGVLECAKLELYRMIATPYEEKKRQENGDIGVLKP